VDAETELRVGLGVIDGAGGGGHLGHNGGAGESAALEALDGAPDGFVRDTKVIGVNDDAHLQPPKSGEDVAVGRAHCERSRYSLRISGSFRPRDRASLALQHARIQGSATAPTMRDDLCRFPTRPRQTAPVHEPRAG
jgi:hypothetical protein